MADEKLRVYWHDDCMLHDGGPSVLENEPPDYILFPEPHVESAMRVRNIKGILETGPLKNLIDLRNGRHATDEEILTFHTQGHLDAMKAAAANPDPVRIDGGGTVVNDGTLEASTAAAGTTLDALNAVLNEPGGPVYSLVRPPGHHAQPTMGDGNCIFNNVAIAVEAARAQGIERVAVIDWDVHHGNGTQTGFFERDDVLTISIHMNHGSWGPNHPEAGLADEIGSGAGVGFNRNVPLPFGVGNSCYEAVLTDLVTPLIADFKPGLIIVAAGEDANAFDPNARMVVTMEGFRRMGLIARNLAAQHCDGRLLLVQEGGYSPTYTAYCAHGMVEGALGRTECSLVDPIGYYPDRSEHGLAVLGDIRAEWDQAIASAS
ncbi:MAG: class II histone deacetylase [Rhodospirillales bacterium]|jgi:acetoin utilization deacetylase AcuC-like enzyme|nr:class II histone deacetylase [Rhodospirillales bacterium]MBT4040655.1 class II histone deacetylase [Rhodospirillales bacterium]MBT4626197.1 class II histone deacetylase [Rhodospirillales bacterium]MBT5353251.1 class II histone deacetylase [Rhodospirillales bacterium]MBT5522442.1 class II histone deacetylase [Rhodospirillales bacterium]